ncbi:glycosyltransferase [Candidatus Woesearchaeota archaeon]|nr:glycosyltransferase [Candidatus Woesearchaeota archaeon]
MKEPLVTVLITAYNGNKYINEAIDSALNQNYQNLEVLIVDDGSEPPAKNNINRIDDSNVRYIYMEHKGLPHGLIKGVEEAKGEYIAVLDQDDVLTDDSISKRAEALRQDKTLGFVYGNINYINEEGNIYLSQYFKHFEFSEDFIKALLVSLIGPLKHSGIMFRKECINDVGNYDPNLPAEFDNDLIIKIAKKYDFKQINDIVVNYRTHTNNTSSLANHRAEGLKHKLTLIEKYSDSTIEKIKYDIGATIICFAKILYERFSSKKPKILFDLAGVGKPS